ncbi:MAG: glycine cleavage T C-terminal barrel domain-containing protein, partial [Candidatus Puniceispirillaceae bacterium]
GGNPIYKEGKLIGRATSGGYGFRIGKSLALAMVAPDCTDIGTSLEIDILGDRFAAEIIEESPFDPANERLRV